MASDNALASATDLPPGRVSVVVINYRGADDTITCLQSLAGLDWPKDRLEVICVDNASGDGSLERIRAEAPDAVVIASDKNTGFAGGCNLGVAAATGDFIAFLNNDARPHAQWLRAALEVFAHDAQVACVASKVLDWEGEGIDYVDSSLAWFGMGYKREVGLSDAPEYGVARDVLFGTGSAMIVRKSVFDSVGGFDERYFMFYEDVDLGWRLNLLGYRVRFEPRSIVYHKHHASMKSFGEFRETYLLERNALLTMYKNYGDEALARCLPAAMALSVRRSVARSDIDARMLDLQVRPGGDADQTVEVPKAALTGPLAIDYFVENLPSLDHDRRDLQARRRRSDADLFPLFRQALEPAYPFPTYLQAHATLVETFGISELFSRRRRIAVVTGEPLARAMAGPAIRALEMARLLATEHDVQLITLGSSSLHDKDFTIRSASPHDLRELASWADVIVFQGLLLSLHPWLADLPTVLVADVYDPFHLEILEQERALDRQRRLQTSTDVVDAINRQLQRADFILCASAKQRDFWLGHLASLGRINPLVYDEDESLTSLIDVSPFGLPQDPPRRTGPGIKGVLPGVQPGDKVVLWGGGVYNWFDPLTLIKAIGQVRAEIPQIRLVFLGMRHPNPGVPAMEMAVRARALSDGLGLTGTHVFFNESWVDYDDRANFLLDADLGVSCHFHHVETEFSFRTRILDYLWAGLPIVCTDGDAFGDLVAERGLGIAVPPEDVDALATALRKVLLDEDFARSCAANSALVSRDFTWAAALRPLVEFCRAPRRAADQAQRLGDASLSSPQPHLAPFRSDWRSDWRLAKEYMRAGGVREVTRRARGRVQGRVRGLVRGRGGR